MFVRKRASTNSRVLNTNHCPSTIRDPLICCSIIWYIIQSVILISSRLRLLLVPSYDQFSPATASVVCSAVSVPVQCWQRIPAGFFWLDTTFSVNSIGLPAAVLRATAQILQCE
ncbi:hypothetical protein BDR04DRAFT_416603 [Suillus decipiens]|nr:hypothetical protein BDR04DRAFT_416603 [Suillus decipiens]